jgi:uncharacterized membrane protein HdeD (DUF308 family)
MKLTSQILIIVILICGLMPLYVGYLSFTDPNKALEMFHIAPMPGMEMIVVIMGICFISFAILYIFDAYLLFKRRHAGKQLAIILGFVSVMSGVIMYIKFSQLHIDGGASLAYVDMAKGVIIILLASMAKE